MPKLKLNCNDPSNQVPSGIKTKQDNNVIDCVSLVYDETKIELLGPIWLSAICDEPRQNNDVTNHIGVVYVENKTKLLWLIRPGAVYD